MCQHGAEGLPPAKQTRGSHWKLFSEQFIPEQGTSEFMNFQAASLREQLQVQCGVWGFGFSFSFLPKVLMAEILMRVSSFHSPVLSPSTTSLCRPLCATMQDFKRCKQRQYAPETCKICCVLGNSSRQKRWGRAMLQEASLLPHRFPLVWSAGFLKRHSLYFIIKLTGQIPPTNKAYRIWQLFLPVEKIPGPITVETHQFLGFVILQHPLGVVSVEHCVQPSSEIVCVWSWSSLVISASPLIFCHF